MEGDSWTASGPAPAEPTCRHPQRPGWSRGPTAQEHPKIFSRLSGEGAINAVLDLGHLVALLV